MQHTKKTAKLQKKKQYESNKTRALVRNQIESNKQIKHNKRKQKRENIIHEIIDLGRFVELAPINKI